MSRLSFRTRLFLALLTATVLPVTIVTGAGVYVLQNLPSVQVAKAVSDLERTFITLNRELALDSLREGSLLALDRHRTTVGYIVEKTPLAIDIKESVPQVFGAVMLIAAVVMVLTVMFVGRTLSAQLSAPLDEVVEWTGRIQRHEALDSATPDHRGIPEFAELRSALRNLAHGLDQARDAELEAERLRAFGEVARRVAHEMKNPLTPIRLAVSQLSRDATPETREVLDVIAVESARLEAMAREFAELGRLPEGIAAPVDLRELIDDLLRSTVPDSMLRHFSADEEIPEISGHYDPLRRAFSNIIRNAVDACHGEGSLGVRLRSSEGWVGIAISDSGPGVPEAQREMIFRPYYTDKRDGTGLGLAIVRQTIEQHGGTISVEETPGGGATFHIRLPTRPAEDV
ncbi:MAG: HAMP domain-containing histidine kinase [Gemmatimonadales bacterium]|nr:HAMP domain-containing histidine kinase [Gemmatimonadales bacterium]